MRKTAAVCVAKLYDINAELVEDQGFLQVLRDLICDPNPTVRNASFSGVSFVEGVSAKRFPALTIFPHFVAFSYTMNLLRFLTGLQKIRFGFLLHLSGVGVHVSGRGRFL